MYEYQSYRRFKWQAFLSPEMIKEFINLMSVYKFNTFHWHLVEVQGWRLEIKKYPKLTSVGAWHPDRQGINLRYVQPSREGETASYGGYYIWEQVEDIVAYASKRNITMFGK